jgi:nucleotide-binding universal stress UspA family protein
MPGPIVCGIDSSPGAGGAARVAAALARELDCGLVLAYVAGESSTFPHADRPLWKRSRRRAAARERLKQMASMLAGLEPSVTVSFGEPAQGLVSICDERDADLLVVAPRLRRGLDRFRPTVSARLMTRTPCPLLLVPEGAARRFFAADLTGTPTVVCGFDGTPHRHGPGAREPRRGSRHHSRRKIRRWQLRSGRAGGHTRAARIARGSQGHRGRIARTRSATRGPARFSLPRARDSSTAAGRGRAAHRAPAADGASCHRTEPGVVGSAHALLDEERATR